MGSRLISRALVAVVLLVGLIVPAPALRAAPLAASHPVGEVKFIDHGLTVTPPGKRHEAGKVKMSLYQRYDLTTQRGQKASIGFDDGTVIHFNQNTDAVLSNPHVTDVRRGEVAQYLAPGTDHQVQTASAVASAIGTVFDVQTNGSTTIFVVLHGALSVQNHAGTVVVESNQASTVTAGHAPSEPAAINALAVFAWTAGLPNPDLGEDVALNANGGTIQDFSSQRETGGMVGHAVHIDDGLLTAGWETDTGQVKNQWVKIGFFGGSDFRITQVIIDPAATYGDPASEDLKHFEIRVSSTDTSEASFTTVLTGTCKQQPTLQRFSLPGSIRARYVELVARDNYGSPSRLAVAEIEVVATSTLFNVPSGVAVDPGGNVYVADTLNDRIVKLSPQGQQLKAWGTHGVKPGQFEQPRALVVDHREDLLVADTGNHRIERFTTSGHLLAAWGQPGAVPGGLVLPSGIAVDAQDHIYVADQFLHRVQEFTPAGELIRVLGAQTLTEPHGIAVDRSGRVFVADAVAQEAFEFSPRGDLLRSFGGFQRPVDVTLDHQGNLFVSDFFRSRVDELAPSGKPLKSFGGFGKSPGRFRGPEEIALDKAGNLYVADSINSRIEKLSPRDKVEGNWGKRGVAAQDLGAPGGIAVDAAGYIYVTDTFDDRIQLRAPDGHVSAIEGYYGEAVRQPRFDLGRFSSPRGIWIDARGEIYVVAVGNHRIQELAPRGPIRAIPVPGKPRYSQPFGVATNARGDLYVSDLLGSRVLELGPGGRLLRVLAAPGTAWGHVRHPEGIAVDRRGVIWIADTGNKRLEWLGPAGKVIGVRQVAANKKGKPLAPTGVAVDRAGNAYLVGAFVGVKEFSLHGKLLATFVDPLHGNPFKSYDAVTVDATGNVYATSYAGATITKFAPNGTVLARWSNPIASGA